MQITELNAHDMFQWNNELAGWQKLLLTTQCTEAHNMWALRQGCQPCWFLQDHLRIHTTHHGLWIH